MLKNKTVLLGVTGSIAAYKAATLASMLKKQHANVHVIMTKNACQFINPITFESLTGNKCLVDTFDRNFEFQVEHISIAKAADVAIVAPASANVIGKMANGIADDMLTTTLLACKCKIIVAPAMNSRMYENPIVQRNLSVLKEYNVEIAEPAVGYLACGDTGQGKMLEPAVLLEYILKEIAYEKTLEGKNVLVTAGPTQEAIDPVRYITNHSTGKMGYEVAKSAMRKGAKVTLISGQTFLTPPLFIKTIPVWSAQDMFEAVKNELPNADIIIKSAAVADYTPATTYDHKIKKQDCDMSIPLKRTTDILSYIGEHKRDDQVVCGFSMETENLIENSKTKQKKKKIHMIAANQLNVEGAGFGTDTNVMTFITENEVKQLPIQSKESVACELLDFIKEKFLD